MPFATPQGVPPDLDLDQYPRIRGTFTRRASRRIALPYVKSLSEVDPHAGQGRRRRNRPSNLSPRAVRTPGRGATRAELPGERRGVSPTSFVFSWNSRL